MKGAVTDEQVQLAKLGGVLQSNTATQEQRRMALKKLQELYPTYFKDLDLEKAKTGDIATAINQATEALKKKAMVAAIDKRMTDLASKEIEKQIIRKRPDNHTNTCICIRNRIRKN
jgi:Tfp pilus assembly protein PilN